MVIPCREANGGKLSIDLVPCDGDDQLYEIHIISCFVVVLGVLPGSRFVLNVYTTIWVNPYKESNDKIWNIH